EAAEKVPFVIPGLTRDLLQSLILSDCGSEAAMTIGKNMHFVSDLDQVRNDDVLYDMFGRFEVCNHYEERNAGI
ncbi:MAG: hypothetical protein FWD05_12320, partial [Oscillospiraceae bacterium]|nr:hypothetical protein [Oscillospiraceae bacterium]